MKLTTEFRARIYDDVSGDHIDIGPDNDGLGLIVITSVASGQIEGRITVPHDLALLIASTIKEVVKLNPPEALRVSPAQKAAMGLANLANLKG